MNRTTVFQAFDSRDTLGRRRSFATQTIDPFVADLMSLTNSDIFRRLQYKTQVFDPATPAQIPVMNRMTHSLSAMAIATTIAEALSLNIPLVQAILLLHDVGHTPISHLGERCISQLGGKPFKHAGMSVNLASATLNLSYETLMGAKLHSRGPSELIVDRDILQEYNVVMYADKIAYIFDDFRDAVETGFLSADKLPPSLCFLGVKDCINGLIRESRKEGCVSFIHSELARQFAELKDWSYQNIYYRIDETEGRLKRKEEMIAVHKFLSENRSLLPFEPLTALAIMHDEEVREIAKMASEFNIGNVPYILNRPWAKLYEKIAGIDLFECNLDPFDFRK